MKKREFKIMDKFRYSFTPSISSSSSSEKLKGNVLAVDPFDECFSDMITSESISVRLNKNCFVKTVKNQYTTLTLSKRVIFGIYFHFLCDFCI